MRLFVLPTAIDTPTRTAREQVYIHARVLEENLSHACKAYADPPKRGGGCLVYIDGYKKYLKVRKHFDIGMLHFECGRSDDASESIRLAILACD
jgi:hypothetical protein